MTLYEKLPYIIGCIILSITVRAMDQVIEKENYFIALSLNKGEKPSFTKHPKAQQQFKRFVKNSTDVLPLFTYYIASINNTQRCKAEQIAAEFINLFDKNEKIGTHLLQTYKQIPFEKQRKIRQELARHVQMRTTLLEILKNNTPEAIQS